MKEQTSRKKILIGEPVERDTYRADKAVVRHCTPLKEKVTKKDNYRDNHEG